MIIFVAFLSVKKCLISAKTKTRQKLKPKSPVKKGKVVAVKKEEAFEEVAPDITEEVAAEDLPEEEELIEPRKIKKEKGILTVIYHCSV